MPDGNPASENVQDFLMTNTPVSFGRDAQQFVKTSKLLVDNAKPVAFFKVLFQPERLRSLKQLFSGLKTPSMGVERLRKRLVEDIEKMAFSPWNTKDIKPLGTMNEARRLVYDKKRRKAGRLSAQDKKIV